MYWPVEPRLAPTAQSQKLLWASATPGGVRGAAQKRPGDPRRRCTESPTCSLSPLPLSCQFVTVSILPHDARQLGRGRIQLLLRDSPAS